ncbi:MAG TPA: hypothetical protein VFO40_21260, partial [Chthoniobacterales bacterium]|nr:hypothetical protein [Chthoniobacterales bacterium]
MSDEIIVGCGASALTHLYYATQTDFSNLKQWRVTVIGKDDLWSKIAAKDPQHRFGQPPQIVHLGGKQPTVNVDPKNPKGFQTADQIDSQLQAMADSLAAKGVKFVYDLAKSISRVGPKIRVKTETGKAYFADRVIVATGFGRSALPRCQMPDFVKKALSEAGSYKLKAVYGDWFNLVMGGTEYLWTPDVEAPPSFRRFRVAIQGASATASWVVLRALELNKNRGRKPEDLQVTWITRSGFAEANPAGRNSDVLKLASDNGWLTKAEIEGIGYAQEFDC